MVTGPAVLSMTVISVPAVARTSGNIKRWQPHVAVNRGHVSGQCVFAATRVTRVEAVMNPELIQTMRAALEAVMDKIPADQSVFGVKAAMAEVILKAAAHGHTSFNSLAVC
jgi:hypothetical protein